MVYATRNISASLHVSGSCERARHDREIRARPSGRHARRHRGDNASAAFQPCRPSRARFEARLATLRETRSARQPDTKPGLRSPYLLTQVVHYHAAIQHILSPRLTPPSPKRFRFVAHRGVGCIGVHNRVDADRTTIRGPTKRMRRLFSISNVPARRGLRRGRRSVLPVLAAGSAAA
jgi:hypothetical protein